MKKHPLISTLLSAALVFSLAPTAALAEDPGSEPPEGGQEAEVTAQEQPVLEGTLEAESATPTGVVLKALEDRELVVGEGDEATTVTLKAEYAIGSEDVWQQSNEFTGLKANTAYTFYARYAASEDGTYAPSNSISAEISTSAKLAQAKPATPVVENKTAYKITVKAIAKNAKSGAAVQYSINKGKTWGKARSFKKLKPATKYEVWARYAETDEYAVSAIAKKSVKTKKAKLKVKGLKFKYDGVAGDVYKNKITVTPAAKYTVTLQMKEDGKWVTYGKKFKTKKKTGKATLVFDEAWWAEETTTWRVKIAATKKSKAFTSKKIKLSSERAYQTPGNYFKISDHDYVVSGGGYMLKLGYMGLKVKKVNSYFGIGDKFWPRYTSTTKYYVRNFQKRHGIKASGNVGINTWLAMGFSRSSWYNMGAYASPLKIDRSSTREDCIEAMIERGYEYKRAHTPYCVGGSGKPGEGADCSGFVMQCLYAAGISPKPSTPVRHSRPAYEYESRRMAYYSKFKKVRLSNIKRGDLVFYRGRNGTVCHVAIYIGGGKCIQSDLNYVQVRGLYRYSGIECVRRPFP